MLFTNIVHFHYFKHHLLSVLEWLDENTGIWNNNTNLLLKSIGNSQLDHYIGNLSPGYIKTDISSVLLSMDITDKEIYVEWLERNGGFQEITISDGSVWTLRAINKEAYIHIHPSRYSKNTIRIKANTLKTVICTLLFENRSNFTFNIKSINRYRETYIGLSPLRLNSNHYELQNVFSLFTNNKKINEQ